LIPLDMMVGSVCDAATFQYLIMLLFVVVLHSQYALQAQLVVVVMSCAQ